MPARSSPRLPPQAHVPAGLVLGPQGAACGGVRVRTVTVGLMSLLLIVLWIAFTGVSSSRSCFGVAAGIWSSGVFLMTSLEGR